MTKNCNFLPPPPSPTLLYFVNPRLRGSIAVSQTMNGSSRQRIQPGGVFIPWTYHATLPQCETPVHDVEPLTRKTKKVSRTASKRCYRRLNTASLNVQKFPIPKKCDGSHEWM